MCLKGFVYCLSHDCPLGIDHHVLATYCWSSSGDSVDSLRRTICITMAVFYAQSFKRVIRASYWGYPTSTKRLHRLNIMNCNVKPVIWECPCHLDKFVDFCTVTWNESTNENDISPQEAKKKRTSSELKVLSTERTTEFYMLGYLLLFPRYSWNVCVL